VKRRKIKGTTMKLDIICRDGSPLGVTESSIFGTDGRMGVGGAELALLTMCRAWKFYGVDITLYNNPNNPLASTFKQRSVDEFNPKDNRDYLIVFRSPNPKCYDAKGKKIWWSCDQQTIDDFRQFSTQVDKIVTISPRHSKYFKDMYGINNSITIDLPVRTWEYNNQNIEKVSKRCIFTSMPDRGLMELNAAWAKIVKEVPEASLIITSDWRLWAEWQTEEAVRNYRLAFAKLPNVTYRAAVKRDELIKIQLSADLHTYSAVYDELFCIAVAESQVAGVFPVTSDMGALGTTNMGRVIHGHPSDPKWIEVFVKNVVELLTDPKLPQKQEWVREVAKKRFSVENIINQWESKVFA
jgi:glycosyltransferase involved in cell wall biosynthesis